MALQEARVGVARGTDEMKYQLYYWAGIQGRGEFVRLALEEAGADYADVARQPGGEREMQRLLGGGGIEPLPFAPPFLRAGELVIGQTANILSFLGARTAWRRPTRPAGSGLISCS